MSEYLISLVLISALVGISSYLSFSGSGDKMLRAVSSLLVVYVIFTPVVALVEGLEEFESNEYEIEEFLPSIDESEFGKNAKAAFEDGVERFVCEKFSFEEDEVKVAAFEFDSVTMKAEKIKIILSGMAVYADARAVSYAVSSAGLGECEVEIGVT